MMMKCEAGPKRGTLYNVIMPVLCLPRRIPRNEVSIIVHEFILSSVGVTFSSLHPPLSPPAAVISAVILDSVKPNKIIILSQPPCPSAPRPTCSVIEQSRFRRWCHKSHYYSPGISTRASATIENRLTPSESVPGTMTLQWCAPRAGN